MELDLAKVKHLSESHTEVDNVSAWVARSRESEAEAKKRAERHKAAKVASMYDEEVSQSDTHPFTHMTPYVSRILSCHWLLRIRGGGQKAGRVGGGGRGCVHAQRGGMLSADVVVHQ